MNPQLTPTQIDEIVAAADHVDVPVEQLLDAAAEIRATLLAASGDVIVLPHDAGIDDDVRIVRVESVRRARVVRTALVAAALALATLLSAALAGALPGSLQNPIADVAKVFGIDLPESDAAPAGATPTGAQALTGKTQPTAGATTTAGAPSSAGEPTGTTVATSAEPAAADPEGQGPSESHGNAYGQGEGIPSAGIGPPETLGVPDALGPPADPGVPDGIGPPDEPGHGTGIGPPSEPGTGNGNNPDGPGA